jgi:2-polyprenyl-3-methyl-5-hydroxy-6-metoxy-1,4-benzoquinol methylase
MVKEVATMTKRQTDPLTQTSDTAIDTSQLFTQAFWDERYGSADRLWSGNPNQRLVEQAAVLAPGTALDVGCGEGADAIWLAARGWEVTGIDVSQVALNRAAEQAARAGAEIAARTSWQQVDLLSWEPASAQFDLVTAHFMHLPQAEREALHRRLASAVRPAGTLLIVGHHPSDLHTTVGRWNLPGFLFTPDEVAAMLDPDAWRIVVSAAPARQATDPEGRPVTIHDAVLRAERVR